ncbi:MAG TPA: hypothetical protein VFA18_13970 [Gemmataceae bacterium]|nr:hypothetical protein [Gemmataceae bacterium]
MKGYKEPDPALAEMIYRQEQDSQAHARRLRDELAERLRAVLRDPGESQTARDYAVLYLFQRKDQQTQALLPALFADPDVGEHAIQFCQPLTDEARRLLRTLLHAPPVRIRVAAAKKLARAKDETIRPVLLEWFNGQEPGLRNAAMTLLVQFDLEQARLVLRQRWDAGDRTIQPEDRLVLAAFLLQLGDPCGVPLLEQTARRAEGNAAVFAAFELRAHDRQRARTLLLHIADDGDLEAKQSLVSQVWNLTKSPHAFTADGIHEARQWIEQHC